MRIFFAVTSFLASFWLLITPASASYRGPLLKKEFHTGHVQRAASRSVQCEVYREKLVVILTANGIESREERILALQGNLADAISKAAEGPFRNPEVQIADAPSTVYTAVKILPNDQIETVNLGGMPGARGPVENLSPEAMGLRNFLDLHCPIGKE